MLFLAPDGELPHEAAWRAWLRGAEGLLPVQQFMAGSLPPQLGLCAKVSLSPVPVPAWLSAPLQIRGSQILVHVTLLRTTSIAWHMRFNHFDVEKSLLTCNIACQMMGTKHTALHRSRQWWAAVHLLPTLCLLSCADCSNKGCMAVLTHFMSCGPLSDLTNTQLPGCFPCHAIR